MDFPPLRSRSHPFYIGFILIKFVDKFIIADKQITGWDRQTASHTFRQFSLQEAGENSNSQNKKWVKTCERTV